MNNAIIPPASDTAATYFARAVAILSPCVPSQRNGLEKVRFPRATMPAKGSR